MCSINASIGDFSLKINSSVTIDVYSSPSLEICVPFDKNYYAVPFLHFSDKYILKI